MYIFFPLPCAKEIFVELIEELDIKPLSRHLRGGCREGELEKYAKQRIGSGKF